MGFIATLDIFCELLWFFPCGYNLVFVVTWLSWFKTFLWSQILIALHIFCEVMWCFVCHNDSKISYYTTILTLSLSFLFMNPLKKQQENLILQCDLPHMGGGFKNWRVNWAVIVRNCCVRWEIWMVCREYGCHNIYLFWIFSVSCHHASNGIHFNWERE